MYDAQLALYQGLILAGKPSHPRSPHWPTVRKHWLEENSTCAACGGVESLEVHHCKPFHLHPDLELDPKNFLTLCEAPNRLCHFIFGHFWNWHTFNPEVREFSAEFLKLFESSRSQNSGLMAA